MSDKLAAFLISLVVRLWPQIEPALEQAALRLAHDLVAKASAGQFPDRWRWAEPFVVEFGKYLPAAS